MSKMKASLEDVQLICSISCSGISMCLPKDQGDLFPTYYFTYCPYILNMEKFKNSMHILEEKWQSKVENASAELKEKTQQMLEIYHNEDLSLTPVLEKWVRLFGWCLHYTIENNSRFIPIFYGICDWISVFQDIKGVIKVNRSYLFELLKRTTIDKLEELQSFPVSYALHVKPWIVHQLGLISEDEDSTSTSKIFVMDDISKKWDHTFMDGTWMHAVDVTSEFSKLGLMSKSLMTIHKLSGGEDFYFDIRDDNYGSVMLGTWSTGGEIQKTPLEYLKRHEPKVYKAICDIIDCIPNPDNVERITFSTHEKITKVFAHKVKGSEVKLMCF